MSLMVIVDLSPPTSKRPKVELGSDRMIELEKNNRVPAWLTGRSVEAFMNRKSSAWLAMTP